MLPWLATPPMPATAPVAVGEYVVQPRERRLLDTRGQAVPIGSRAFELLLALIERAGQVVSLDELKELAWPGIVIEPNTLRVHMASLRKALRDNQRDARYIATIPGRGYSLICRAGALAAPDVPRQAARPSLPLPSNHDPVIGRDETLAALFGAVQRHRLITLVAGGGMGKSTLAREVAQAALASFDEEVQFIDLVGCPDAVATELITAHFEQAGVLGKRGLLVLDNCDKALDGVASSVLSLTSHDSLVHVLATSREPLGLLHEQLHWLRPLVPEGSMASPGSAARLLADRVRASDGGRFSLTEGNILTVIELCRRVSGLPLAIELVAESVARLGLGSTMGMSAQELLVLPHPRRTAPGHHASLDALFRSSHERLDDVEKAILQCCSQFDEAFTFEMTRQSLAARGMQAPSVLSRLFGLLEKSLIEPALDAGPGHVRVPALMRCFLRQPGLHGA